MIVYIDGTIVSMDDFEDMSILKQRLAKDLEQLLQMEVSI